MSKCKVCGKQKGAVASVAMDTPWWCECPPPRAEKGVTKLSTLAQSIKALRINLGLTQEEVADAAGIARTTLVNIETGRQGIPLDTLEAIAEGLGYHLEIVFKKGTSDV